MWIPHKIPFAGFRSLTASWRRDRNGAGISLRGDTVGIQPHFPLPLALPVDFGWSGVDLFFVFSGFLIGGILLEARQSTNYFRVFYKRRIYRIFPIYFTYLAVFFFGLHFMQSPLVYNMFHPEIPWHTCVTFTQNFWMAFRNDTGSFALVPTWSLAVEEQFYLTIPALVYFVKPRAPSDGF